MGLSTENPSDYTLQLAPAAGELPNFTALKNAFENTVRDTSFFVSQCRRNFETRYAQWSGQSYDGKKHQRDGSNAEVVPWDGASDMQVFLADQAINDKVAMQCMAFRRANIEAVPIQGADITRAKDVTNFMRWLIYTQVPEMDREVELLSQYLNEQGVAISGQFWEVTQEKTLDMLRLVDFQAKFPETDILTMLEDPISIESLKMIFTEHYAVSSKKANTMVRELRETGETTVPVLGRPVSRPIFRAFNLTEDIFIPPYTTDLETCPGIYRVQYFTPEKLRSFVTTDGWDEAWVEAAIEKLRGQMLPLVPDQNLNPTARTFVYRYQRYHDLIGVVFAYQRLSDEDGVPGIYLTVFNPLLPADEMQSGYAKHGLLGYRHGNYPFVLHRREYLSRRIHDTRGIPEVGQTFQNTIKAHRDGRIDAASIGIIPPMYYPSGRAPSHWGPGVRIPVRRADEYGFVPKPAYDLNTDTSEKIILDAFREYFAIATPDTDPVARDLLNQNQVNKFLINLAKAFNQIWKLYQQFGDDNVYFRVIGQQSDKPMRFGKGDPTESYEFYLNFDVQSMNAEQVEKKLSLIYEIAARSDKYGQVDWGKFMQISMSAVDPTIAEAIIMPRSSAQQQLVAEEKNALSRIFAGFVEDVNPKNPPDIGMMVMQQWMQMPDVQQRYAADQTFKARVDTRMKQLQQAQVQQVNADTGRLGATFGQVLAKEQGQIQ